MRNGWLGVGAALLLAGAAQAGLLPNGDFETNSLAPWIGDREPDAGLTAPPMPMVTDGTAPGGINGPSGSPNDAFAVLSTALPNGVANSSTIWAQIQQDVTLNGITAPLTFQLVDPDDSPYPPDHILEAGVLLDNIELTELTDSYKICFDYDVLVKNTEFRNDYFSVQWNGTEYWRVNTADINNFSAGNGGGGNNYGPFTYGTGWQDDCFEIPKDSPPPVPEPGSLLLLSAGLIPVLRRRRAR